MKTKQVLKMKPQPEMRKTKTFPRNLMTLSSKGRSVFYICIHVSYAVSRKPREVEPLDSRG